MKKTNYKKVYKYKFIR